MGFLETRDGPGMLPYADPYVGASDYDRPTHTHRVVVTFEMEEMNGTPEESAEVLLDQYIADEVTIVSVVATEVEEQEEEEEEEKYPNLF